MSGHPQRTPSVVWLAVVLGLCACGSDAGRSNLERLDGSPPNGADSDASGGTGGTGGTAGGRLDAAQADRGTGGTGAADAGAADARAFGDSANPSTDGAANDFCFISIAAVSPPQLTNLLVGSLLHVRADLQGNRPPTVPAWKWTVTYASSADVTTEQVGSDPTHMRFLMDRIGNYTIHVQAGDGCQGVTYASAVAASQREIPYWVRIVPPTGVAPITDTSFSVKSGQAISGHSLMLDASTSVRIDPHTPPPVSALRSYLRITGRGQSSVRIEGESAPGTFRTPLSHLPRYDVLIIPNNVTYAPFLLSNKSAAEINAHAFELDQGTLVSGTLRDSGGAPVKGRVLLRAGALSSTTGIGGNDGRFSLRARSGGFSVTILPPVGSPLPEAEVPEIRGIGIGSPLPPVLSADFTWRALPTTTLGVTVRAPNGSSPVRSVRVRLETTPGALPDVGVLTLATRTEVATGFARFEQSTGADGTVAFPDVPLARYILTLIPNETGAAVTTLAVDLESAGPTTQQTVSLSKKVRVSGRLLPAARVAGRSLAVLDMGADIGGSSITAVIGDDGRYAFDADPGRTYRLFVEPTTAPVQPRVALGSLTAPTSDLAVDDRTLAPALSVTGMVTSNQTPVAGAHIQVFCLGAAPECIDSAAPSLELARPVFEAVTGANGTFGLAVPDPGMTN